MYSSGLILDIVFLLVTYLNNRISDNPWTSVDTWSLGPGPDKLECSGLCSTLMKFIYNSSELSLPTNQLSGDMNFLIDELGVCRNVSVRLKQLKVHLEEKFGQLSSSNQKELKEWWNLQLPALSSINQTLRDLNSTIHGTRSSIESQFSHLLAYMIRIAMPISFQLEAIVSVLKNDVNVKKEENKAKEIELQNREYELVKEKEAIKSREIVVNKREETIARLEEKVLSNMDAAGVEELKQRAKEMLEESRIVNQKLGEVKAREKAVEDLQKKLAIKERETLTKEAEIREAKVKNDHREKYLNDKETSTKKLHEENLRREDHIEYFTKILILAWIGSLIFVALFCTGGRMPWSSGSGVAGSSSYKAAPVDLCHVTLTRERNMFFRNVLMQKLAESNIRPRADFLVLNKPADFNNIPRAKCYVVHWTSQRMSIFSDNWTHRGLLRSLGNKPYMILVYDSERIETLGGDEICDRSFRQIETEAELRDAMREQRLITYRANERFNAAQEQALKNWVNANAGADSFRV